MLHQGRVDFEGDPRLKVPPPKVQVREGQTEVSGSYRVPPPHTDRSGHLHIRLVAPDGSVLGDHAVPLQLWLDKRSFWHHGSYDTFFPFVIPDRTIVRVQAEWGAH